MSNKHPIQFETVAVIISVKYPLKSTVLDKVITDYRGIDTLSRAATLSKRICLLPEKESTLKGKNLLPVRANSSLLVSIHFQKELCVSKPL